MRPPFILTEADINRIHHLDDAKQKVNLGFGQTAWLHHGDLISNFVLFFVSRLAARLRRTN